MVIVLLSFYAMFGAGSRGCAGVYVLLCAGASSLYVIFYLKALWGAVPNRGCGALRHVGGLFPCCGVPFRG